LLFLLLAIVASSGKELYALSNSQPQIISFNPLPVKTIGDAPFTLSATTDSGLPITYLSSNPNVATVTGSTVTIVGIGRTLITASQVGNGTFSAASATQLLTVNNVIQTPDQQGQLWGVLTQGGKGGYGSIIKTSGDGTGLVVAKDFNPDSDGFNPSGPLTLATNNKFYGLTSEGGANLLGGVLFEYDPLSEQYTKKFDFSSYAYVFPELTASPDGKIYGVTYQGDFSAINSLLNGAVIFEFDVVKGTLTPKVTLNQVGNLPVSNLIRSPNGKLYGIAMYTNTNKSYLYEFNPNTNKVVSKSTLDDPFLDGIYSSYICFGPNGKIYGTNQYPVGGGNGYIFEYDTTSNVYTKRADLPNPNAQGFTLSSNGKLYALATGACWNMIRLRIPFRAP